MLASASWDPLASTHRNGFLCTWPGPLDGTYEHATSFAPIMRAQGYLINTPEPAVQTVPITTNWSRQTPTPHLNLHFNFKMNLTAMPCLLFSLQGEKKKAFFIFFSRNMYWNPPEIFSCSFRVLQSELIMEKSHKIFTGSRGLHFIFQFKFRPGENLWPMLI